MTVAQAIAALLYDHDTVIVPALGAFVRHDVSAQVNVITNEFQKPSSTLEFDPAQREENSLLIEHLMQHDNISNEEARQRIAAFVAECYTQMREGKTVTLEGLGTLALDGSQELVFEPDATADFNADAFGLDDLEAQPVFGDTGRLAWGRETRDEGHELRNTGHETQDTGHETLDSRLMELDEVGDKDEPSGHGRRLWWLWLLLVLLLLGGGAALWYFMFRPVEPQPLPPTIMDTIVAKPVTNTDEPVVLPVDTTTLPTDTLAPLVDTVAEPRTDTIAEPFVDTVTVPEPTTLLQVVQPDPESKAFIIGGCFGTEDYALNMATAAIEQGCVDAFVMKRGSKFYVAYGQYPTSADAKAVLPDIVANYNPKAWILNK